MVVSFDFNSRCIPSLYAETVFYNIALLFNEFYHKPCAEKNIKQISRTIGNLAFKFMLVNLSPICLTVLSKFLYKTVKIQAKFLPTSTKDNKNRFGDWILLVTLRLIFKRVVLLRICLSHFVFKYDNKIVNLLLKNFRQRNVLK